MESVGEADADGEGEFDLREEETSNDRLMVGVRV